jgi:hypothetical protein
LIHVKFADVADDHPQRHIGELEEDGNIDGCYADLVYSRELLAN